MVASPIGAVTTLESKAAVDAPTRRFGYRGPSGVGRPKRGRIPQPYELHLLSSGDHAPAVARYVERMRPFLRRKQTTAAGFALSFAPKSAFGIVFRNLVTRMIRFPFLGDFVLSRVLRDDIASDEHRQVAGNATFGQTDRRGDSFSSDRGKTGNARGPASTRDTRCNSYSHCSPPSRSPRRPCRTTPRTSLSSAPSISIGANRSSSS